MLLAEEIPEFIQIWYQFLRDLDFHVEDKKGGLVGKERPTFTLQHVLPISLE